MNNNYYNTYFNETTVITVSTVSHVFNSYDWEVVAFDYSQGDKMIAVWHCFESASYNPIDVLFMNKENYQLFIDGSSSYNAILSAINATDGFMEYEIIEPNLYFTVFNNNYTNAAKLNYQVTQYCL